MIKNFEDYTQLNESIDNCNFTDVYNYFKQHCVKSLEGKNDYKEICDSLDFLKGVIEHSEKKMLDDVQDKYWKTIEANLLNYIKSFMEILIVLDRQSKEQDVDRGIDKSIKDCTELFKTLVNNHKDR